MSLSGGADLTYIETKEIDMTNAESLKIEAEITNLNANTAKLQAETAKLLTENR